VTTIHLHGLAERADCAEQPLGPDVTVPEKVNVYLEFDLRGGPVGTATLRRDEQGIWADVTLETDARTRSADLLRRVVGKGELRKLWPAFAISVARTVVSKSDTHPMGVITAGEVANMSLCRANRDPGLPPYEVVRD
jgi:hypothetical protein